MMPPLQYKPNTTPELEHVFVYGTLKRGQCREDCWPAAPVSIEPAWTRGSLWDLGPYPALLLGSDRVLGELWSFESGDISTVLRALDQIEGTNQPGLPNEYDRVQTRVTSWRRGEVVANTYRYADPSIADQLEPLMASSMIDGHHYVQWPSDRPLTYEV